MANEQNLIPNQIRTASEAGEKGRAGGIASGKARRLKKHGRELMLALLAMREPDPRIIAELAALGIDTRDITKEVAMQARQIEKAIKKGDTSAFKEVNRLAGHLDGTEGGSNVNVVNYVVKSQEEAEMLRDIAKRLG